MLWYPSLVEIRALYDHSTTHTGTMTHARIHSHSPSLKHTHAQAVTRCVWWQYLSDSPPGGFPLAQQRLILLSLYHWCIHVHMYIHTQVVTRCLRYSVLQTIMFSFSLALSFTHAHINTLLNSRWFRHLAHVLLFLSWGVYSSQTTDSSLLLLLCPSIYSWYKILATWNDNLKLKSIFHVLICKGGGAEGLSRKCTDASCPWTPEKRMA